MNKTKILILRFSSIGDIILTTPVPRVLKTQLDNAEIHFCTKKNFEFLIKDNPYIDKCMLLEGGIQQLITKLKKEKYDYIIDLHNNLRTRIIKLALFNVKSYSFDKLNYQKWLLVNFKINKMPSKHIVERYIETIKPLGVKMDSLGLDYFIPEKDKFQAEWLPSEFENGFISFVIGTSKETKRLPIDKMIQLCDKINKPIVLLGGKEDEAIGDTLTGFFMKNRNKDQELNLSKLGKKTIIFNACGKFNFNQSSAILKKSTHVFSHDTGLMHVAAAFKKEVFSIWGNTVPELGMYPYRTKFSIFEVKNLECRPCSKIGYSKCPKGHFKCMNNQIFDFYIP